jgi:hypothetical protein
VTILKDYLHSPTTSINSPTTTTNPTKDFPSEGSRHPTEDFPPEGINNQTNPTKDSPPDKHPSECIKKVYVTTPTLNPTGESAKEEYVELAEDLSTDNTPMHSQKRKRSEETYLHKVNSLPVKDPKDTRSLYDQLVDQKNLVDLTERIPEDRRQQYYKRLLRRNNRILAVAARYQIPREEVDTYLQAPDSIDTYSIQQILQEYQEYDEKNEPSFASRQADAADTGSPVDYEEIRSHIKRQVEEAEKACDLTGDQTKRLHSLYAEFEDIIRIDIGKTDPPQKIDPYEVKVAKDGKPRCFKARGHSHKATEALKQMLRKLEDQGLIYKNASSHWASPAFLVEKPGKKGEYRLVIDLRYVNMNTLPISWEMPNLEHCMHVVRDAKYFGVFDFPNGFWQIEVEKKSQEVFSFVTPLGTYTPTRLPQGHHSSPLYFHAHLQQAFQKLIDEGKALLWIDDILICAKTFDDYLDTLRRFLEICRDMLFKISAKKSTFLAREVQWCGRIVDGEGTRYHPRNYDTLEKLEKPTNAGELSQFCSALNWMSHGLPGFAAIVDPLRTLLETIYKMVGSRERIKYQKIDLVSMWTKDHQESFDACKNLLVNTIKQAHYKPGAQLCVISDASDRFYGALLTQVLDWKEGIAVQDQQHEPLAVLSGKFNETQLRWSTISKEAYPIVEASSLWDHFLLCDQGVRFYTDHNNIAHLFKPEKIDPPLKRSSIDRIHRWLHQLSHYRILSFEHIKGENNHFADMISRWGQPDYYGIPPIPLPSKTVKVMTRTQRREERKRNPKYQKVLDELHKPSMVFPTKEIVRIAQQYHYDDEYMVRCEDDDSFKSHASEKEGMLYYKEVLWIPTEAVELQQRILTISHCGECGHVGAEPTLARIKTHYYWKTMEEDAKNFIHNCLCCEKLVDGNTRPIPWGEQTHATKRNEILTFDYLYIEKPLVNGLHSYKYILALKDEYSGQIELIPTKACDHHSMAEALAWWIARYGKPLSLRSDQGSHFKAKVLEELTKKYKIQQNFTLPYSPWANGAIEILNKTLLRVLRSVILENNLQIQDWPYLLPLIQGVINGTTSERLAGHAPREVFMGLQNLDPLEPYHILYHPKEDSIRNVSLTSTEIESHLRDLHEDLKDRHKKVDEAKKRKRIAQDKAFRKKHNLPEEDEEGNLIPDCDFRIGDYVLVAMSNLKSKRKLEATWRGPFKVIGLVHTELNARGDYRNRIYIVEHLITKERKEAHARRIRFYADKFLDTHIDMTSLENHITSQEATVPTITRVIDYKFDNDSMDWMVHVEWHDGTVDNTSWEPLEYVLDLDARKVGDYWRSLSWHTDFDKKQHFKTMLESNYHYRLAPILPELHVQANKRLRKNPMVSFAAL